MVVAVLDSRVRTRSAGAIHVRSVALAFAPEVESLEDTAARFFGSLPSLLLRLDVHLPSVALRIQGAWAFWEDAVDDLERDTGLGTCCLGISDCVASGHQRFVGALLEGGIDPFCDPVAYTAQARGSAQPVECAYGLRCLLCLWNAPIVPAVIDALVHWGCEFHLGHEFVEGDQEGLLD